VCDARDAGLLLLLPMTVCDVKLLLLVFFVEYAANGSLYNFLQQPQSQQLTFENTLQWAKDIARG